MIAQTAACLYSCFTKASVQQHCRPNEIIWHLVAKLIRFDRYR